MATKPSTDLTVKSLEDSGIRTTINQGDLIDIVVQDRQDRIQSEVDRIDLLAKNLSTKFSNYLEGLRATFLSELQKIDSSITIEQITLSTKNRYNSMTINGVSFKEDVNARVDNIYDLSRVSRGSLPSSKDEALYVLGCNVTTTKETEPVKGIKVTTDVKMNYTKEVKIAAKTMAAYYKDLESINAEVDTFLNSFSTLRINMNKITKEIKTKLNKTILKNQSPELQAQMKKVFDIDL